MRLFSLTLSLIFILGACSTSTVTPTPIPESSPTEAPFAARDMLTGEWLGGFTKSDGSVASLLLNFDEANLNIEPQTKLWSMTVTQDLDNINVTVTGETGEDFEKIDFTGSLSNGVLTGDMTWDAQTSPITFTPIYAIDSALFEKYAGVYRFESGRALSVIHGPSFDADGLSFFHQGLTMTDFESGDSRGIYPLDDFTFAVGALRVVGAPFDGRVQFIVDDQGQAIGLMWWDTFDGITPSADSGQYATRVNYLTEEVTFTSPDGAVMAGLLTSPETSEPHAAFMMLHGSEPGVKNGFGQQVLAHYMISEGIALLTYDKRGVGDSEGSYSERPTPANIDLIASDAVAGAEYLSTRSDVDSTKIGLIGGSQAGWVIPVAAKSESVDFFVITSGPVISFGQEDRYSSVTNDGDSATTYDPEKLDQTLREMTPSGVDPIPVIAELTQPGLWLWGSVDKSVPVTVSAENLQAIMDSGKNNFSYTILPNGDHNLNESAHGYFAEIPYAPRVLYFSRLTEWLEQNNLTSKE